MAYSVYDAFFKPERGMTEVRCWMHSRGYFFKAMESDQPCMGPALHLIARLRGGGARQGGFAFGRAEARVTAACVGAVARGIASASPGVAAGSFAEEPI